jgi:pimeloyl-ACP methyl ester carboxylesterase
MRYLILIFALFVPIIASGQHHHSPNEMKKATLTPGLGDVYHPVSTANAEAQKFFNQGLAYIYAFNHDEAVRAFKRASELDPQLAMAYWGVALALGSNYNLQADAPQLKEAYAALEKARALAPKASEHERGYIEALSKRYSSDPNADRQALATNYKNAMGELVKRYPDDLDAATLYAESMMNLRPWKLWTPDGKPAEGTEEIVATLESVLRRNPNHTGANHYYIHAVEASPNPERGLPSASRLGHLAPAAGHLVHMPSHIYIRTGDYEDAARSNADAIVADRDYLEKSGAQGVYPMMYYNHNIHFLASAHAMNGRYSDAIKTARELEANVKPHLKAMPMLEMFMPYSTVAQVRFHKWDEILKSPAPDRGLKITNAFWHFARGMAYARKGQIANAEAELKTLIAGLQSIPEDAPLGNSTARGVLQVAEYLLGGNIAFARGDKKTALDLLHKGVEAEDKVSYNEPPDWDLPVREWLGGALLTSGDNEQAEKVFRAELAKHARNGRALFGLYESLKRQGKHSSGQMVKREFDKAWEKADTKLSIEEVTMSKTGQHEMKEKTGLSTHPISPRWRFADAHLKTGVRLQYAEQGDPSGQPVIMIHGYSDSWFSFSRVLPLLDAKYHAFALTMRGHGDSDSPAEGYKFSDFAADVLAFIEEKQLERVTIVGHSMGSFIAQRVALGAPERVARLILVGSATGFRKEAIDEFQQAVNALSDPVPQEFAREFQYSTTYQPVPIDFMAQAICESLKLSARVWRATMAGMLAEQSAPLDQIMTPALILWGDHDFIFTTRADQDKLAAAIKNATLKVYTETGHAVHWERPEQFARDLEDFIGR